MPTSRRPDRATFDDFVRAVEPALLQALVSSYGPVDGREATVDALSWAWEHWDRLESVANKIGYLYRVGQTATRHFASAKVSGVTDRLTHNRVGMEATLERLARALER